jgi:non-canonical (house-cleaning) NTP pyrophosphatase
MSTDNEAKIRRWEQYIEESRKEARLLSPEGQQELQTVIQSYEKLIAMARDQATKALSKRAVTFPE